MLERAAGHRKWNVEAGAPSREVFGQLSSHCVERLLGRFPTRLHRDGRAALLHVKPVQRPAVTDQQELAQRTVEVRVEHRGLLVQRGFEDQTPKAAWM